MPTITELLQDATQTIKHSCTPRLDAEILLCQAIQCQRSRIYSHPQQYVNSRQLGFFHSLINRRQQGYPVAYLTGKKEFWSLTLAVNQNTLIPRPETECLVQAALEIIPDNRTFKVLDLGTGSGAIAVAIAHERPNCNVTATDISSAGLAVARQNGANHWLDNIKFLVSDWYQNIPPTKFDMIISNPPYIARNDPRLSQDNLRFEPTLALISGVGGMQAINTILASARDYLADDAYLFLEHGYKQKQPVRNAFLKNGFKEIVSLKDLAALDRLTYGRMDQTC